MSEFVKIVSWHIQSGVTSRGGMIRTLCGKWADQGAQTAKEPPPTERSCEGCYRVQSMRAA